MADVVVHLQLLPDLGLPYEPGAESALAPADFAAFAALAELAGLALTLVPSYELSVEELGDFMAAARLGGIEPPDLFSFFAVTCPEEVAADLASALETLPFVLRARESLATEPPIVWSVVADPLTFGQDHLRRAPMGVDAFATWVLPGGGGRGVRVADMEKAWDLAHPDLIGVQALGPFPTGSPDDDHGTYCVGLMAGASNAAVSTGVAPAAQVAVSPFGAVGTALAILLAARQVGRGGVVLLELATSRPGSNRPDAPLEHNIPEWGAIRAAVALGVLVVEPAGNGSVDLDTDPLFSHISRPDLDSGALLVAAGENISSPPAWRISLFSTRGTRIDCFAPGEQILGPTTNPAFVERVDQHDGTSPAAAITAGVAATVQGLAIVANGQLLTAAELHARLRDRSNGTLPDPPTTPIGVMPDLAKLALGLGFARIPPLTAAVIEAGLVVVVRADPQSLDDLDVLLFDETLGISTRTTIAAGPPAFRTNGHELALHPANHGSVDLLDFVTNSERGTVLHRALVPNAGFAGPSWQAMTNRQDDRLLISAPLTMTVAANRVIILGLEATGPVRAHVAERDPVTHELVPTDDPPQRPATGHEPEIKRLDPLIHFEATPALTTDAGGDTAILIGVDRAGRLRHATWSLLQNWSGLELVDAGLDPFNPPAVVADGTDLHVLAVDETTRELRTTVRSQGVDGSVSFSALRTIATPFVPTFGINIEAAGGLYAAGDGAGMLMALALDVLGRPLFTVRLPGLDWSPLFFVPSLTTFAPRGGIAIASPAPGVFIAAACDDGGAIHTARWNQVAWTPFVAA